MLKLIPLGKLLFGQLTDNISALVRGFGVLSFYTCTNISKILFSRWHFE